MFDVAKYIHDHEERIQSLVSVNGYRIRKTISGVSVI